MISSEMKEKIMLETIELAKKTPSTLSQFSPKIGTILTDDEGNILEIYYKGKQKTEMHCEEAIIFNAKKRMLKLKDAMLFTTMEPSFHRHNGKETNLQAIKDANIKFVFIGINNQNQYKCREGEKFLKQCGIRVELYPEKLSKMILKLNSKIIQNQNSSTLTPNSKFLNLKIPEIMVQILKSHDINYIDSLPEDWDYTFGDIVSFCRQKGACSGGNPENLEDLLHVALGSAYDEKYFSATYCDDVRGRYSQWKDVYKDLLMELKIDDKIKEDLNVIVVGIGNGQEAKELYQGYKKISLVDVAPKSLDQAASVLQNSDKYLCTAQNLRGIKSGKYDVYISLMTFQSTYFDIDLAVSEINRVLKNNGIVIISVASGYIKDKSIYIDGLVDPKTNVVSRSRPYELVNKIVKKFITLEFMQIGVRTSPSEIFISAIKRC